MDLQTQKAIEQKWHAILTERPDAEKVRTAYEELHSFYLRDHGFLYRRSLDFLDIVVLRVVGKGKKVLELGFGSGVLACALAQEGNEVLALDVSSVAVKEARELATRWVVEERVWFRQGDAVRTGEADGAFDVVISVSVFEHLHPSQVRHHLREVRRILRPNGAYLLCTPIKYDGPTSLGMHLKEWSFCEVRDLLKQHGFRPFWVETRTARLGKPILFPLCMLWLPELMERMYARLSCKRWLRPLLRPTPFFYARKVHA